MVASAGRFRADALHARAALAATAPASAVGRSGRRLALAAFADYATAGSRWIVSGKARVAGHRKLATTSARAASQAAAAGNALLVAAGNKLRRS